MNGMLMDNLRAQVEVRRSKQSNSCGVCTHKLPGQFVGRVFPVELEAQKPTQSNDSHGVTDVHWVVHIGLQVALNFLALFLALAKSLFGLLLGALLCGDSLMLKTIKLCFGLNCVIR